MKYKGIHDFKTTVIGVGVIKADDKGFIEATNKEVVKVLKQFGFEEVKEPKKK